MKNFSVWSRSCLFFAWSRSRPNLVRAEARVSSGTSDFQSWSHQKSGFKLWWNYFIIHFSYTILYDCTLLRHLVQIFWSHTILLKTLWFFTKKFSEFDPMISFKFLKWVCQLSQLSGGKNRINYLQYSPFYQCCRAGACGAKIIWGPGAGAENKFK